jgi:hypothetical protein
VHRDDRLGRLLGELVEVGWIARAAGRTCPPFGVTLMPIDPPDPAHSSPSRPPIEPPQNRGTMSPITNRMSTRRSGVMTTAVPRARRRTRRRALVAAGAMLVVCLAAFPTGAVGAAPPGNDSQAGAVPIAAVPFSHTQDTSEATADAGEAVASDFCLAAGAPAFEHAVWFAAVVPSGSTPALVIDVTQSTFGAGIAILQEVAGGELLPLSCSPGTFVTTPGAEPGTYYIVAFGDGTTPSTNGQLVFTVDVAPAPPEVELSIDDTGSATRDGSVRVSGTVTCTAPDAAAVVAVEGQVTQSVGRFLINSSFSAGVASCDGAAHAWEAWAAPSNGTYGGGRAVVSATAFACALQCGGAFAEADVKLSRGRS